MMYEEPVVLTISFVKDDKGTYVFCGAGYVHGCVHCNVGYCTRVQEYLYGDCIGGFPYCTAGFSHGGV